MKRIQFWMDRMSCVLTNYSIGEKTTEITDSLKNSKNYEGGYRLIKFKLNTPTYSYLLEFEVVILENPIDTGYVLEIYDYEEVISERRKTTFFGFINYTEYYFSAKKPKFRPLSDILLKEVLIPVLQEMSKTGFVYGWTNTFSREIQKKLAPAGCGGFLFF